MKTWRFQDKKSAFYIKFRKYGWRCFLDVSVLVISEIVGLLFLSVSIDELVERSLNFKQVFIFKCRVDCIT